MANALEFESRPKQDAVLSSPPIEIISLVYHSHRQQISDSFACRARAYCHSPTRLSPRAEDATWKANFRVFGPNHQDESNAAVVNEPDPLDEPLSPLPDE